MAEEKWATPAPLGFAALALVCLGFGSSFLGWIPKENVPILFALGLGGGVAQIIAGIIDLKRGDAIGGNLLATFGCMFMLTPAFVFLLAALKLGVPTPLLGYVNILLGIFLGLYMIPLVRAPIIMFFIGPLGLVLLVLVGIVELGAHHLQPIAGWLFIVAVIWGLYMMAHALGAIGGINIPLGKPLAPIKAPPQKGVSA
jgi:hypothetical protein